MTTTASVLPNGRTQFLSDAGAPLAGGSVGFYTPNTLNPMNTWQDPAQAVLNVNPVPLDAAGSALIWGTGLYRMIVKDALGNQIYDVVTFGPTPGAATGGFGDRTALASAATTDLGTVASHNVLITGATQINSFGQTASVSAPYYVCQVDTGFLCANGINGIQLPGQSDYQFLGGDSFLVEYIGAGTWRVLAIWPFPPTSQSVVAGGVTLIASDSAVISFFVFDVLGPGHTAFHFPIRLVLSHQTSTAGGTVWAYGEYVIDCVNNAGALQCTTKTIFSSASSDATKSFNPAAIVVTGHGTNNIQVQVPGGANVGAGGINKLCYFAASRFGMGVNEAINTGAAGNMAKPVV